MEFSLFTLEDNSNSQDPVALTPTRSFSNSSVSSSSSSSSSLVGINPILKQEQHNKLIMSINEDFKPNPPIVTSTITTNSTPILTTTATSPAHPITNQFTKQQTASAAFKQNLSNLSKSPNFNSFYFFNDDDEEEETNRKNSSLDYSTFNSIPEETSTTSNVISNRETGLELDSVKHKLSNLWNNMKYNWVNYMKKPNKLDTESDLPIYILGKEFYSYDPENATDESVQSRKYRHFAAKSVNSSYYDYFDASGAQPNLSASITNNYSIVPKPAVHFSTNASDGGFLSLTYSNVSTSPPVTTAIFSPAPTTINTTTSSSIPMVQQQPNALLNSFTSMESSNTTTTTVSPPLRPRQQFLNRFLSENLIKTPLEQEIYSRLWFTYRKDFHPLRGNPKYTSDCGWGCMLRSGQMMIAQALIQHHFSKNWSLLTSIKSKSDLDLYRDIVSLFNDRPNMTECPFGLHNMLEIADESSTHSSESSNNVVASTGRPSRVGTWFGPTAVCLLMRDALNECVKLNPKHHLLQNVRVYVAQDCTIFRQDVLKLCMNSGDETKTFIPCIILISVRLGGESINKIYYEPLKEFLRMNTCIGMVGGKPRHSLYFIGYQGDKVIYLDPHLSQPTVNVFSTKSESKKKTSSLPRQQQYKMPQQSHASSARDNKKSSSKIQFETYDLSSSSASSMSSINSNDSELFDNSSFHCASPSKTAFSKLDPSLAIGFYCQTLKEFDELCNTVKKSDHTSTIFGVSENSFEQTQLDYESFNLDERSSSPPQQKKTPVKSAATHSNEPKQQPQLATTFNAANNDNNFLYKAKKKTTKKSTDDFVLV